MFVCLLFLLWPFLSRFLFVKAVCTKYKMHILVLDLRLLWLIKYLLYVDLLPFVIVIRVSFLCCKLFVPYRFLSFLIACCIFLCGFQRCSMLMM